MNHNDFIAISLKTHLIFKESSMWCTRVLYVYPNYQDSVLVTFNNQLVFFFLMILYCIWMEKWQQILTFSKSSPSRNQVDQLYQRPRVLSYCPDTKHVCLPTHHYHCNLPKSYRMFYAQTCNLVKANGVDNNGSQI